MSSKDKDLENTVKWLKLLSCQDVTIDDAELTTTLLQSASSLIRDVSALAREANLPGKVITDASFFIEWIHRNEPIAAQVLQLLAAWGQRMILLSKGSHTPPAPDFD